MTISELHHDLSTDNLKNAKDTVRITFSCPVCKARKELDIKKKIINQKKQLTTVSFSAGLICEHCFQAFIDKHYKVRGYQKVDYEFSNEKVAMEFSTQKDFTKEEFESDKELLENLDINTNHLKYNPTKNKRNKKIKSKPSENLNNDLLIPIEEIKDILLNKKRENHNGKQNLSEDEDNMDLKEIFQEFREFIDKNNPEFSEFIENEERM